MLLTIICIILITAAIVLSFFSAAYASAPAFLALCVAGMSPGLSLSAGTYIFWSVAMILVLALNFMLPPQIASSRRGLPYIAGASLAGVSVAMSVMSHAAIITGAVFGAVLGSVAYGRTPRGRGLGFPSAKFLNYMCAKGLPVAITMSIAGIATAYICNY